MTVEYTTAPFPPELVIAVEKAWAQAKALSVSVSTRRDVLVVDANAPKWAPLVAAVRKGPGVHTLNDGAFPMLIGPMPRKATNILLGMCEGTEPLRTLHSPRLLVLTDAGIAIYKEPPQAQVQ